MVWFTVVNLGTYKAYVSRLVSLSDDNKTNRRFIEHLHSALEVDRCPAS